MDDESMKKGDGAMNAVPRPALLVAIIIGSLYLVEAVIMNFFHEFAETAHGTMDALILTTVLLPLLYFFIYRPFSRSVKDLKAFSGTLERQVRERTVQLEFSEALHRAVIASSADAIVRISSDGAILSANPAAHWMFGYGKTELENKRISLLLPDGYERVLVEGFAASLDGWDGHSATPVAEAVAVTKSGKKLTVECASSECLVNSEISFVIVMRDVSERRKAEKELISIMEAQPDILYVIDLNGALIKWNSALQELCGLTRGQMMGRPAADFVCEEDRRIVMEGIKEVFEKGSASIEARFIRHDGELVPHLCNGAVWKNQDGETLGLIGVGKDISERKKAEEVLRASEQKFIRFFTMLPIALGVVAEDGVITEFNARFTEAFGYTIDDIPTIKEWWEQAYPDESYRRWVLDTWGKAVEKAAKEGTDIESVEYKVTCKGGAERFVMVGGIIFEGNVLATFADVTEKKKAEQAIRESEGRYHQLAEASFEGIVIAIDGKILDTNSAFARMFGYAQNEIIGKTPLDFLPPESYAIVADHIGRGSEEPYETVGRKKNGALFPMEIRGRGTLYHGQKARVTAIRDITERVKAEQIIRESEEKYRVLVEETSDWVWELSESGAFTYSSPQVRGITGYGSEELLGKTPFDYMGTEEARRAAEFFRATAAAQKPFKSFEHSTLHKDGHEVVIETSGVPYFNAEGRFIGYRGINRDITERRRIEEELARSENKYRSLFQEMVSGFSLNKVVFDERGEPVDYITLEVNRGFEQMLGVPRESVIGKKAYETVPNLDRKWLDIFGKVALTGKPYAYVEYASNVDKWFEGSVFSPGKDLVAGTFIDITERKRAGDELRRSEENLRKAQEIAHVGNWHWDMVNNTLLWSDEIYRIFGLVPREFGATYDAFLSYVHPDDRVYVEQRVNDAIAKKSQYDIDHRIITPGGGERIVHEVGEVSHDGMGRAVSMVGTVQDITERKHMEDALRKSEERLNYALEATGEGVWDWHLTSDLVFHNAQWCRLLGLDEKFLVHPLKDFAALLHDDDREAVMERIRRCLDGKGSYRSEHRMKTPGGYIWALDRGEVVARDGGGKPLRMIGSFTDITTAKRAEDNLRASEQRFRAVAQSASDAIISINGAGKIIHWNTGAEKMFGHTESETLGKPVELLIPKRYDEAHRRGLARAAAGGPYRLVGKTAIVEGLRKDGAEFPLELSLAAWEEGGNTYFTGIIRDITERKAAEEKLKAAKEEAEEATKLKDKFISLVSHDLKTPLASMLGFLKLVRHDYAEPLNDGAKMILDRAVDSGEAMVHLIDDLLTISRFKTGQLKLNRQFFDAEYLGVMMAGNTSVRLEVE